jgi:hypothetical protein
VTASDALSVRAAARRDEARVESKAQRTRRWELLSALCTATAAQSKALRALLDFEAAHGRAVERLLDEAARYDTGGAGRRTAVGTGPRG